MMRNFPLAILIVVVICGLVLAGAPAKVRVSTVQDYCIADGFHRFCVLAEILDSANIVVPTATNQITFGKSGGGTFQGETTVYAVNGRAVINLISPTTAGSVNLYASSPGLTSIQVTRYWIAPRMNFTRFPIGIYDDISAWWYVDIRPHIDIMRNHNIDSLMMGNGKVGRNWDEQMIQRVQSKNFDLYMGLTSTYNEEVGPLNYDYFADTTPTLADARYVRDLVLDDWGGYSCIKAWYTADEPDNGKLTHVQYITESWQEADFTRPATPVLIGKDRVGNHYDRSDLDVLCIDLYPAGYSNPISSFNMGHWGYSSDDMVSYYRYVTDKVAVGIPVWVVLQTHNFQTQLRQPEPEEVSCMHWITLAEGAKGYFWFIYSTIASQWTGLRYQTDNFNEVSSLAARVKANSNRIKNALFNAERVPDMMTISGPTDPTYIKPHITTLMSDDGTKFYSVAVNHDCQNTRNLTIDSFKFDYIKDVETQVQYSLPVTLSFAAGDGKVFELIVQEPTTPSVPTALSFTQVTETKLTLSWQVSENNPSGYRIYNDANDALVGDTAENSFELTGLNPGQEYCYYIIAYNNAGDSDPTSAVCQTTYTAQLPSMPDDVGIAQLGAETIELNWQSATDNVGIAEYDVYVDGAYNGTIDTNHYTVICQSETKYDFQVLARDVDGGESDLTPAICATSCAALLPTDLLGYWKFDENAGSIAYDSSNYGNNGTISGAAWTTGQYDKALDFDGSNDYVNVGNINPTGDKLTITAWIYPEGFSGFTYDNRIVSKAIGSGEEDHYWMVSTVNNGAVRLRFRLRTNGDTLTLKGESQDIPTGQWIHIAAVYDGSTMKLYKNAVADSKTESKTGNIENSTTNVLIGANPSNVSVWNGKIDDVRIYNEALSVSDLQMVMAGGEPLPGGTGDCNCSITGDFNCSCNVDFEDFVYIAENWQEDTFPMLGDMVEDDIVNILDFARFALNWLEEE